MNWNKATHQQKLKYQQASKIWLSKIPLFEELTSCDNPMCKNKNTLTCEKIQADFTVS